MSPNAPRQAPPPAAAPRGDATPSLEGKTRSLVLLALATLFTLSLWFSASAVAPRMVARWDLGVGAAAWLTMSVQIGFVAGALLSALGNLADRLPARGLLVGSALLGAAANAAIALAEPGFAATVGLRFVTGAALAGVYPPSMKLMATWTKADRGLWIGILVGALAVGSATPHLLGALAEVGAAPGVRVVLLGSSVLALAGAGVAALGVRTGPFLAAAARVRLRHAWDGLRDRPLRLANVGYFGHMWELYAMWTWLPLVVVESFASAGWSPAAARLVGFAAVAVGGLGSAVAGFVADRWGRTRTAEASLWISGFCALAAGALVARPGALAGVALLWGLAVVADSAQFSASASELADVRYVGTALTVQTALGFTITVGSIQLVPVVAAALGWFPAFALLAAGPAVGIVAMRRLRAIPEARAKLASGRG